MSTHEPGAMAQAALMSANKLSWALRHGPHTTHSAFAPCLNWLMSAHECSWVLMGTLECSWVLLSTLEGFLVFEFSIQ